MSASAPVAVAPTTTSTPSVITTASAPVAVTPTTISAPAVITSTTVSAITSGTALVETVVASNDKLLTNAEVVTPINIETAVVALPVSNEIEPTSTKPVPAKRDVPLPEALPEPIEEEVITATIAESVDNNAEIIVNDVEVVEVQETLHTVTAGENLYSISVKYNVKLKTLRQWNNIDEKDKIRIGEKLYVVDPQTVKNINE
jgi:type IV pilus assembly protein PilF